MKIHLQNRSCFKKAVLKKGVVFVRVYVISVTPVASLIRVISARAREEEAEEPPAKKAKPSSPTSPAKEPEEEEPIDLQTKSDEIPAATQEDHVDPNETPAGE